MPNYTKNLNLFKYDPSTDGSMPFDVQKALNDNFDKIDSNSIGMGNMTNCILEIPQRIKYTLEDGILTIKAGSVVIVPYGVEDLTSQYPKGATFLHENFKVYDTQFEDGKFFVWAEFQNDISYNYESGIDTQRYLTVCIEQNSLASPIITVSSTSSTVASTYTLNYRTDLNKVHHQTEKGSADFTTCSFVLMKGTSVTGQSVWTTIDQVFQGMGYIGSTIWADKGIKGLMPIGRNENRTLKNKELVVNKLVVRTFTEGWTNNYDIYLHENYYFSVFSKPKYHEETNTLVDFSTNAVNIGSLRLTSNVVSNFSIKQPFRAVDYNDASILGMPSNKYINLTLGASGSIYVAPANGWVFSSLSSNKSDSLTNIYNETKRYGISSRKSSGYAIELILPVAKGDAFSINYDGTATNYGLRFYYAQGEI